MDNLILFTFIGFIAQLIDGSLGMAYGVTATSFMLGFGLPPVIASASVHTAEVFTTAISGLSHWRMGNVNWGFVAKLSIPGVIGGLTGAYLLTSLDGNGIKPYISAYLLIMGLIVLIKVFRKKPENPTPVKHYSTLGLFGGVFDAMGGGGWGPIVTTTLLSRGGNPREVVGSVNFSEFFVTFAQALAFMALLPALPWQPLVGLLVGGAIAAPLGAYLVHLIPGRGLMATIGVVIVVLSIRTIMLSLGMPFLF